VPGLRILIADDHELVRRGLRSLLESQPGWQVVAEAKDGAEAVQKSAALKPDIVILDFAMPQLNGLGAIQEISKVHPAARILMLSMHQSENLIREALDAGARGYVTKSSASWKLVAAVEAVQRGRTYVARTDPLVLDSFQSGADRNAGVAPDEQDSLTPRQTEVIRLLAEGRSSKQIAAALGLSVKTAETHRSNILRRLRCHSASELTRYAIRNHIIEP
jgi:DNA-binding NarL/FixJ family response regulator